MTEEEQQRLEQLDEACSAIKNIEVPEQWKKPDNGPMLTLLAIKDFGPAVVPTLARVIQTNVDLLRENNEVHREHMKSERKLLFLTKALLVLTAVLALIAIPPAIESFRNIWPGKTDQNPQQTKESISQPTKTEQSQNATNHMNRRAVGENNKEIKERH
jgi:hypothetical protein